MIAQATMEKYKKSIRVRYENETKQLLNSTMDNTEDMSTTQRRRDNLVNNVPIDSSFHLSNTPTPIMSSSEPSSSSSKHSSSKSKSSSSSSKHSSSPSKHSSSSKSSSSSSKHSSSPSKHSSSSSKSSSSKHSSSSSKHSLLSSSKHSSSKSKSSSTSSKHSSSSSKTSSSSKHSSSTKPMPPSLLPKPSLSSEITNDEQDMLINVNISYNLMISQKDKQIARGNNQNAITNVTQMSSKQFDRPKINNNNNNYFCGVDDKDHSAVSNISDMNNTREVLSQLNYAIPILQTSVNNSNKMVILENRRIHSGIIETAENVLNVSHQGDETSKNVSYYGYETAENVSNHGYETSKNVSYYGYETAENVSYHGYETAENVSNHGYKTANNVHNVSYYGYETAENVSNHGYETADNFSRQGYRTAKNIYNVSHQGDKTSDNVSYHGYGTAANVSNHGNETADNVSHQGDETAENVSNNGNEKVETTNSAHTAKQNNELINLKQIIAKRGSIRLGTVDNNLVIIPEDVDASKTLTGQQTEEQLYNKIPDFFECIRDTNKRQSKVLDQLSQNSTKNSELYEILFSKHQAEVQVYSMLEGDILKNIIDTNNDQNVVLTKLLENNNKTNELCEKILNISTSKEQTTEIKPADVTNKSKSPIKRVLEESNSSIPKKKRVEVKKSSTQTQCNEDDIDKSLNPKVNRRKSVDERQKRQKVNYEEYEITDNSTQETKLTLRGKSVDNVKAASVFKRRYDRKSHCRLDFKDDSVKSTPKISATTKSHVESNDDEFVKCREDLKNKYIDRMEVLQPANEQQNTERTLKHRRKTSSVRELTKDSNVYICWNKLLESVDFAVQAKKHNGKILCKYLIREIFTEKALSVCDVPGNKNGSPILNKRALVSILDYIQEMVKRYAWEPFDEADFQKYIKNMLAYRRKKNLKKIISSISYSNLKKLLTSRLLIERVGRAVQDSVL